MAIKHGIEYYDGYFIQMTIKHRSDFYKLLPPSPACAEIGVAEGLYSMEICQWKPSVLYCVDAWECLPHQRGDGSSPQQWHDKNYKEAMARLNPYEDIVAVLRGPSTKMHQYIKPQSLDFIYLDACHTYDAVKKDLENWFPKLKYGGVMAGHDYLNPDYGVKQAVDEFCYAMYRVKVVPENRDVDASFFFRKHKHGGEL